MRPLRAFLAGSLLVAFLALPAAASAAETRVDSALRQLTLTQVTASSPPAGLEKRIQTERTRIRSDERRQLVALVDAANAGQAANPASVATAVKQQQALVDMLKARRQEAKVDLDLLDDEESVLQDNAATAKGSALEGVRRRMADLLSRRALLEERISAIDEVLAEQEDRLTRLGAQERAEAFGAVVTIGMYVGILVLIIIAERFVRRRVIGRIADRNRRYLVMKIFTGVVYVTLLGWIVYRIAADYPGIVTSFAIVGAGIAVALQAVIKDIVGWIIIMQKRLFTLGQRITIGPYTGDVADVSLLRTTLVEVNNSQNHDTGRIGQLIYLPNAMVLDQPVMNFHATSDFMEAEISITVTVDSDWQKAEEILRQILHDEVEQYVPRARLQHTLRTAYFFASLEPPDPRIFVDITEKGVQFTLRFSLPIGQRRSTVTRIYREILTRFAAAETPIRLRVDA